MPCGFNFTMNFLLSLFFNSFFPFNVCVWSKKSLKFSINFDCCGSFDFFYSIVFLRAMSNVPLDARRSSLFNILIAKFYFFSPYFTLWWRVLKINLKGELYMNQEKLYHSSNWEKLSDCYSYFNNIIMKLLTALNSGVLHSTEELLKVFERSNSKFLSTYFYKQVQTFQPVSLNFSPRI